MDTADVAEKINKMWLDLGDQIAAGLEDMALDDPAKAIRYACAAEACLWKGTGESTSHDVKDVLPLFPSPQESSSAT